MMKRLLLVLLVVLLPALGFVSLTPTVAPLSVDAFAAQKQPDPETITVYITRTGQKYHRDGCRSLSRSRIASTLKEAVERGLGPCGVCKPPTIK